LKDNSIYVELGEAIELGIPKKDVSRPSSKRTVY
jgi:hypothetical protein